MTKKFFQGLFAFFVAALLSVSLTACPDDPVTPEPGNPSGSTASAFSLVGTWKSQGEGEIMIITFNADGTMLYVEAEYDENGKIKDEYKESGAYKYDDNSKTLTMFFEDGTETYKVEVLSPTVVVIQFEDGDYPVTFKKQ
ncbi:MAG: lipocalin family protein [Bacteroidaceae bacterium]|nr:lipocalin family protein [Bacteroidaceae bacterium]